MKKKVFTIFIVASVLICCLSGVYASAQAFFNHVSYLEEHIDWIHGDEENSSHYPENLYGSCTYVAMSLMLSFYDAYWRDEFVPTDYETIGFIDDVTGNIWHELHFNIENTDWAEHWANYVQENGIDVEAPETEAIKNAVYDQFVTDNRDKYFHMFLISLGEEKGYHDGETDYGLNRNEVKVLLNHYLQTICHISSTQVEVHLLETGMFTSREDLFNEAKEKIEQGFPVLYGGKKPDDSNSDSSLDSSDDGKKMGHMLLAYKLTDDENDIVLAPGWNGEDTQTFNTTKYQYDPYIIWLEIKDGFNHQCSVSYKYSSTSDKEYCVCEIFSEHPNHEHVYNATGYSDNMHWKKCLCGEKEQVEEHDLTYKYCDSEGNHHYTCACGYRVETSHIYSYTKISGALHRASCACGHVEFEAHAFRSTTNPRYSTCYKCGYTRDNLGSGDGNVIMGPKKEEETE